MILRAITLIRDEIDIINLFLRHLDALFDEVILLDHQSIDGTTELLKQAVAQRPGWKYYRIEVKQKFQKQMMNFFIEKFRTETFDYLFFLDTDEFLWVEDRRTLEKLLANGQNGNGIYGFQWMNSIPVDLDSGRPIDKNTKLFVSDEPGGWQKIAVDWNRIDVNDFCVQEGNHSAFHLDGQTYPNKIDGKLLHIPIRSRKQFVSKTLMTQCSLLLEANRTPGLSYQYSRFLERIARDELNDSQLVSCLYYYQIGDDPIPAAWEEEFLEQCAVERFKRLGIAYSDRLKLKMPKDLPSMERKIANALTGGSVLDPKSCTLVLEDETISLARNQ